MENLQKLKVLLNLDTDAYDAKLQLVWDTLERQTMIAIGRGGHFTDGSRLFKP